MANQIEVPKLTQFAGIGASPANSAVGKLVMFILLEPSSDAGDTSNKQGHIHTQIIRRD